MNEFEILSHLHLRYGLTPSNQEFGRLKKVLLTEGYAKMERSSGNNELQITTAGIKLLRLLEEEYREVVSNVVRLQRAQL
ncbi:MAG: hypothetical protein OK455_10570 [Thaumarchaeota archaeon]|nr:hypothetical protein [Nitrososphaerota archaeon]